MIKQVDRAHLDIKKYNYCIENSTQNKLYGFSWYLDCVAKHWSVLVYGDYEAVMPIPIRKKYGLSYVYPPFWVLELGIFSMTYQDIEHLFISYLKKHFKWTELRLNEHNHFDVLNPIYKRKEFQSIDVTVGYENLHKGYRSDRKKDLRKAEKANLKLRWNDDPKELIALFRKNVGSRVPKIKPADYQALSNLISNCLQRQKGKVLSVYLGSKIVASCFILLHKQTATILVSATDFKNRNNGANTFMIDELLKVYASQYERFYFGGSSIKTIADYFLSFGATTSEYPLLRMNELPFFLRWLKR